MPTPDPTAVYERHLAPLLADLPDLAVLDAHTHLGHDVDGTVCAPAELLAWLERLGARAAVFPLHVESGYARENDLVLEAAAASGGRLVPFCRLDPHDAPAAEAARAVAAGARGIKLHPRAEAFTLAHPALDEVFALADAHALPVLIHAGLGIEALGADLTRLAGASPRATVILAHAGITDLAWIADVLDEHPNVLFDTAWWNPIDLLGLFALVPPGRIVFGSDAPFGHPALNAVLTLRCAHAVGLGVEQLRSVMGGQLRRLLDGEPLADLGPAPGGAGIVRDPFLDRIAIYLAVAWGGMMAADAPGEESQRLLRQTLAVGDADPRRETVAQIVEALTLAPEGPRRLAGLVLAATLAATPGVPVPTREPLAG
jgi:predicted TIM-barrel fold metal-dependent hydrolase